MDAKIVRTLLIVLVILFGEVLPCTTLCSLSNSPMSSTLTDETSLTQEMLNKQSQYVNTFARPVFNRKTAVHVKFAYHLYNILDVDAKSQLLKTKLWTFMTWTNQLISWNPDNYNNISSIWISSDCVWIPDVILYNSADRNAYQPGIVEVDFNGQTYFTSEVVYTSSCQIDISQFPFDVQSCELTFASWLYDDNSLRLDFFDLFIENSSISAPSSEWEVKFPDPKRNVHLNDPGTWYDLTFYIELRRRPGFYVYVLIVPSLLLSILTPMVFWIPPARPDRTALGLSLFSSFFVLLLVLVQILPSSASKSQLGIYYCYNMALVAASTLLSVLIIFISNNCQSKDLPRAAEKIIWLGKLLVAPFQRTCCIKRGTNRVKDSDEINKQQKENTTVDMDLQTRERKWKAFIDALDRLCFFGSSLSIIIAIACVYPRPP